MARRGLRITAIEPGPALAAQARKNLAGYPVHVVSMQFEDWDGTPGEFAAVVAATAWHWVDPRLHYQRAARALRPAGHLAVWGAQDVFPADGEIEESGQFDIVIVEHFDWTVDYDAEAYINLLRSFSGHIAMAPADRERLFTEIRQRLARRPSGTVRRGWGTVLHIARVRPGQSDAYACPEFRQSQ